MGSDEIRFRDGAAYEQYMGKWSQLVGKTFLDWLAPAASQQWLDVGCGNGAFTEMVLGCCAPTSMQGVDPSLEQLAYARVRPALQGAVLRAGDAMALPYPDAAFDIAVMPLVIFFVPDPARGVTEMVRVVRPGGSVAAYAWDMVGGGFPYEALLTEIRRLGLPVSVPPSPDASRIDMLRDLWAGAGLEEVETCEIEAFRTFANFGDFWSVARRAPSVGSTIAAMADENLALLKTRVEARLPVDADGRIRCRAHANAVKGHVPK